MVRITLFIVAMMFCFSVKSQHCNQLGNIEIDNYALINSNTLKSGSFKLKPDSVLVHVYDDSTDTWNIEVKLDYLFTDNLRRLTVYEKVWDNDLNSWQYNSKDEVSYNNRRQVVWHDL
ncbi:MAG: hypothetical protein MI922_10675 [Bacteroidales bacterium]|nr:hypothetical protein [Bacteroidales bacterium]